MTAECGQGQHAIQVGSLMAEERLPKASRRALFQRQTRFPSTSSPWGQECQPWLFQHREGWKRIKYNYDIGAAVTFSPRYMPTNSVAVSEARRFKTTSGEVVQDEGLAEVRCASPDGHLVGLRGRLAFVHQPLISAPADCKKAHVWWTTAALSSQRVTDSSSARAGWKSTGRRATRTPCRSSSRIGCATSASGEEELCRRSRPFGPRVDRSVAREGQPCPALIPRCRHRERSDMRSEAARSSSGSRTCTDSMAPPSDSWDEFDVSYFEAGMGP